MSTMAQHAHVILCVGDTLGCILRYQPQHIYGLACEVIDSGGCRSARERGDGLRTSPGREPLCRFASEYASQNGCVPAALLGVPQSGVCMTVA
jgi:hypothetical protein